MYDSPSKQCKAIPISDTRPKGSLLDCLTKHKSQNEDGTTYYPYPDFDYYDCEDGKCVAKSAELQTWSECNNNCGTSPAPTPTYACYGSYNEYGKPQTNCTLDLNGEYDNNTCDNCDVNTSAWALVDNKCVRGLKGSSSTFGTLFDCLQHTVVPGVNNYTCALDGKCYPTLYGTQTKDDCEANCKQPITTWSCNESDYTCHLDPDGPFASPKACADNCKEPPCSPFNPPGKYSCNNEKCTLDPSGKYNSFAECSADCSKHPPVYKCNPCGYCELVNPYTTAASSYCLCVSGDPAQGTTKCNPAPSPAPSCPPAPAPTPAPPPGPTPSCPTHWYLCDTVRGVCSVVPENTAGAFPTQSECNLQCSTPTPPPDPSYPDQWLCGANTGKCIKISNHSPYPGSFSSEKDCTNFCGLSPAPPSSDTQSVRIHNNLNVPTTVVFDSDLPPCLPLSTASPGMYSCLPSDDDKDCDMTKVPVKYFRIQSTVDKDIVVPYGECSWSKHNATIETYDGSNNKVPTSSPSSYPNAFNIPAKGYLNIFLPKDSAGNTYWCSDTKNSKGTPVRVCNGLGGWFSPYDSDGNIITNNSYATRFEFNPNTISPTTQFVDNSGNLISHSGFDIGNFGNIAYNTSGVDAINSSININYTVGSGEADCTKNVCGKTNSDSNCDIDIKTCPLPFQAYVNIKPDDSTSKAYWSCVNAKHIKGIDSGVNALNDVSGINKEIIDKFGEATVPSEGCSAANLINGNYLSRCVSPVRSIDEQKLEYHKFWDSTSIDQNQYAKMWTDYLRPNPDNLNLCNITTPICNTYASAYDEQVCASGDCCPVRHIYGEGADYPTPSGGSDRYNPIDNSRTYADNPVTPLKSCVKDVGGVLNVTLNDLMPWKDKDSTNYFG